MAKEKSFEEYYQRNSPKGQVIREKNLKLDKKEADIRIKHAKANSILKIGQSEAKAIETKAKAHVVQARANAWAKMVSVQQNKLTTLRPAPMLSKEQAMIQDLFGSDTRIILPAGRNLPHFDFALRSGYRVNHSNDPSTGRMFGVR